MSPEQHNRTLRQKLWEITDGSERAPVSEHAQRFSDLASIIPHTIKVLPNPYGTAVSLKRFTCFMHVLGLAQCSRYIEIATRSPELFAGIDFMLFLLHEGILREIVGKEPTDGDMIIYFDGDQPKHAGFVFHGRVRSKWGTYHFVEHGLWEVSIIYGDEYGYFEPVTTDVALEAFLNFVRSKSTSTAPPTFS